MRIETNRTRHARPVVCGVDDREWTRGAVAVARDLAERLEAPLVLVHARQLPVVPGASGVPRAAEELERDARDRAEMLLAWLAREHRLEDASLRFEVGDPARCLVEVASRTNAQLVVVGSRGHPPWRTALSGSVSSKVIAAAACPVVVVAGRAVPQGRVAVSHAA